MSDALAVADVNVGGAVSDMLRSVLLFLPKALGFIVILVVGWLVARLVRTLVDKVLERVGFDRAVERGGIKTALARSRYDASDLVARLVYYAVLLFTLQLAFGIWGPNPVSDLIKGVVAWLPKAFVAILIVVVAAAIASAVRDIVGNALGGLSYGRLLANIAGVFIIGIGVIAALNQIGVATTVTTPILIAVLATIGGILVVGVGGGLVRPMQQRWEGWLDRAANESQAIAEHAKAYQAGQADARESLSGLPPQRTPADTVSEPGYAPASTAPPAYPAGTGAEPTQVLPPVAGERPPTAG
jgi:Conserved TM helix